MKISLPFSFMLVHVGAMANQNLRRVQSACTAVDDYDFEAHTSCNFGNDIKDKVIDLLDEVGCGHGWREEIVRLSGERTVPLARAWMSAECAARMTPQACLDLTTLDLPTIGSCSPNRLFEKIREELDNAGCRHNAETEVRLLHRDNTMTPGTDGYLKDGADITTASEWLVKQCQAVYGCTTYTTGHTMRSCDTQSVIAVVREHMPVDCEHTLVDELKLITGQDDYESYIENMCAIAWNTTAPNTDFTDIDPLFDSTFMEAHNRGDEFLNLETGNFQGDNDPAYPTSDQSNITGQNIKDFYTAANTFGSGNSVLNANFNTFDQCSNQAAMCCWGRDRQSGDGNGDCDPGEGNCDDADPADNTNLCYTRDTLEPFPGNSEGNAHCHGFAWGNDKNDVITQLGMNVYFFVAMYDHLYDRGYVEEIVDSATLMCGCVEDMSIVTRSDCSEVNAVFNLRLQRDGNHLMSVVSNADDDLDMLDIRFRACRGTHPATGERKNNDLASYANKLKNDGKMSQDTLDTIYETLVGYNATTRFEGEEACETSYCTNPAVTNPTNYTCP